MKNFYSILEKSEKWDTEMQIIKEYSDLVDNEKVIAKAACYYPRLKETKKRGRIAFIELYKNLCCDGKIKNMAIEDFELFVCKHREWGVYIQPTDKYGGLNTEYILQTEINDNVTKYLYHFEFLMTPNMPSITIEEDKIDNVTAIKNLANNLEITGQDSIKIIKYFVEGLQQLWSLGDNP